METTLKHRVSLPVPFDEFRVWAQQMRPTISAGGEERVDVRDAERKGDRDAHPRPGQSPERA